MEKCYKQRNQAQINKRIRNIKNKNELLEIINFGHNEDLSGSFRK